MEMTGIETGKVLSGTGMKMKAGMIEIEAMIMTAISIKGVMNVVKEIMVTRGEITWAPTTIATTTIGRPGADMAAVMTGIWEAPIMPAAEGMATLRWG